MSGVTKWFLIFRNKSVGYGIYDTRFESVSWKREFAEFIERFRFTYGLTYTYTYIMHNNGKKNTQFEVGNVSRKKQKTHTQSRHKNKRRAEQHRTRSSSSRQWTKVFDLAAATITCILTFFSLLYGPAQLWIWCECAAKCHDRLSSIKRRMISFSLSLFVILSTFYIDFALLRVERCQACELMLFFRFWFFFWRMSMRPTTTKL